MASLRNKNAALSLTGLLLLDSTDMGGDTVHLPKMVSVSACSEVAPELYFLHSSAYPTQRCDLLTV
jgi:hypothetical protein